jgi:hypothetical protein
MPYVRYDPRPLSMGSVLHPQPVVTKIALNNMSTELMSLNHLSREVNSSRSAPLDPTKA